MTRVGLTVSVAALLALPPGGQQPTFKSGVDLVRVDLLVVQGNRPVAGLTSGDFEVFDNGVRQEIDRLAFEQAPIDVLLVLDSSLSVSGLRRVRLLEAGQAFLDGLGAADRAGLLAFAEEARLLAGFTSDLITVRSALDKINASGSTALLDALYAAVLLPPRSEARELLLLFSDGIDNTSWLQAPDVLKVVRGSDAVIYCVSVNKNDPSELPSTNLPLGRPGVGWGPQPNTRLLQALAEETGGRLFTAESINHLRDVFVRVVQEMKARYLLTYYPAGVARAGQHTLQIRLKNKAGQVIARKGYYIPPS